MLDQILNAITHNPWILALGTIAFFTIKGVLWLLIPFLVIRWRRLVIHRRQSAEAATAEASSTTPATAFVSQTKRAA